MFATGRTRARIEKRKTGANQVGIAANARANERAKRVGGAEQNPIVLSNDGAGQTGWASAHARLGVRAGPIMVGSCCDAACSATTGSKAPLSAASRAFAKGNATRTRAGEARWRGALWDRAPWIFRAAWLIGIAASIWARPARADAPAEHVAAARALGVRGIKLADQGKCEEAIESLERAEALYHAPTILGRLGECQVLVGKIVLGTENLYRVTRESLPADAPNAYRLAQTRARNVLQQSLPRIGVLVVRVDPTAAPPSVDVDGVSMPQALLGQDRPTDPGTHWVSVSAAGYEAQRLRVELKEGARQELNVKLVPVPQASGISSEPLLPLPEPPTGAADSPVRESAASERAEAPDRTPAYVCFGLGAAGLVTGAVAGVLALTQRGDLACTNKDCPPDQHADLDRARRFATISTIGFGVAMAGAAAGGALLWFERGGHANKPASARPPQGADSRRASPSVTRLRIQPWVGWAAAGLNGEFQ
ncbi:MAG TPA: hypothetical protein VFQ61_00415 [Polyangiaceae bacterium]|nr:hypothetical protein [Polyangiaceae bacterium]